jgi:hypothetical protein
VILLILALAGILSTMGATSERSLIRENPLPVFSSAVLDIAREFLCSCGGCDVLELVQCTCEVAIQEKVLIQNALEEDKSRDEAIGLLDRLYGGRKP